MRQSHASTTLHPKDKNATVTIDFAQMGKKRMILKTTDTDSNHTPKEANIVRGAVLAAAESNRSKASIVREIEKVTKFTEADIRASWKFKERKAK